MRSKKLIVLFTISSYVITLYGVPAYADTPSLSVTSAPTLKAVPQKYSVSENVLTAVISRDSFSATSKEELDFIAAEAEKVRLAQIAEAEAIKVAEEKEQRLAELRKIIPNPSGAQLYAHEQVLSRGWSEDDYVCLVALWNRESGWRVNAANPSSGAYGIPQSLPGTKMATAGDDWQTNPETQIRWGLGYIQTRYMSPCGAWEHSEKVGWY